MFCCHQKLGARNFWWQQDICIFAALCILGIHGIGFSVLSRKDNSLHNSWLWNSVQLQPSFQSFISITFFTPPAIVIMFVLHFTRSCSHPIAHQIVTLFSYLNIRLIASNGSFSTRALVFTHCCQYDVIGVWAVVCFDWAADCFLKQSNK